MIIGVRISFNNKLEKTNNLKNHTIVGKFLKFHSGECRFFRCNPANLLYHSDQGSHYTIRNFRQLL